MMLLLDLAVRSSILVLAGLGACALLGRRTAALRHAVLAMAIFAGAALVPLTAIVPAWHVALPAWVAPARPQPPAPAAVTPLTVVTGSAAATPRLSPTQVATSAWLAGVAACAGLLLAALARLDGIARRATPVTGGDWARIAADLQAAYRLRRPVAILQTDVPNLLATLGARRPGVLLPVGAEAWDAERIRAVLAHELAHVRRRDWLVQMAAEAVRCLYWFNPLLWIACTRLRCESELACDDAVLGGGMPPREYAAHLLDLVRAGRRPRPRESLAAMPMARASSLERRIAAMLNPHLDRTPPTRRGWVAAAILIGCLSYSVAGVRAGGGGQTAPATLAGTVYDPAGGVVPGVSLTLVDAQERTWTARSDAGGRFEFPAIAPGSYALEAALPGFRTLKQDLALRVARDWDRAITLQVGEVSETVTVSASRVAPAPGPLQPQPSRLKVGGNIKAPRKLYHVAPVYPQGMREAGREGIVPIEAGIGIDGTVTAVRVLSADIHPDFAIAAVDAVRQWRFDPTLLNGVPIEIRMRVSIAFKLSN